MDLSSNYDLPNPYGLLAADFNHDMDSYRACLGYLGDLATGSEPADALKANGGTQGMLVGWQHSDKFRRVHEKCKKAGNAEQRHLVFMALLGGILRRAKPRPVPDDEPRENMIVGTFHLRRHPDA